METRGPQAITVRDYNDFLSKGLIFAYQQPHHKIMTEQSNIIIP